MHRIALTAALALTLSGTAALAQQTAPPVQNRQGAPAYHRHGHGHNPHRQAEMLSKRLNLTPDQTAKLEPILAARQQKMSALRSDTSLTPEARRAQFKAIHEESKQQFASVLTPEQREQMKSMRHHGGMHRHGQQPPTPAGS